VRKVSSIGASAVEVAYSQARLKPSRFQLDVSAGFLMFFRLLFSTVCDEKFWNCCASCNPSTSTDDVNVSSNSRKISLHIQPAWYVQRISGGLFLSMPIHLNVCTLITSRVLLLLQSSLQTKPTQFLDVCCTSNAFPTHTIRNQLSLYEKSSNPKRNIATVNRPHDVQW